MTSLKTNVKAAILVGSILTLLFAARAAFSFSREEIEAIDASMALPAFGMTLLDLGGAAELSIADLRGLGVGEAGSRGEAGSDEAPNWLEDETSKAKEAGRTAAGKQVVVSNVPVRKGETIGNIASRFGVTVETVMSYNNLTRTVIRPGMTLQVPSRSGVRVKLKRGESPWDLSRRYSVKLADILEANGIDDARNLRAGQSLFIVGARSIAGRSGKSGRGAAGGYIWPVRGGRLSSKFGFRKHPINRMVLFHRGIDLAAPMGSKVRAFCSGRVVFSGQRGGYGNLVEIRHDNGLTTRYAHNQRNLVKSGQRVEAGQEIAAVGTSGHSTGPHVHFEVISNGKRRDPATYF